MPDRYRSAAARELVAAIRAAGGSVERVPPARLRVTGPRGAITIQEPAAGGTRRDLRSDSPAARISDATGLAITSGHPASTRQRRPRPAQGGPRPPRHGTVTRWDATSGFITDTAGQSWFASRDDLPPGTGQLSEGTPVTFSGTTRPSPGKSYPRARNIRREEN
jgi:hypothetical protein